MLGKQRSLLVGIAAMAVIMVGAGMLRAEISEQGGVAFDQDGIGWFGLMLETSVDPVAGFQGTILYDPAQIGNIEIHAGIGQPGSFVVRSFEIEPGEMKFVVYSATEFLNKGLAALECRATVKDGLDTESFTSVVVHQVGMIAGADIAVTAEPDTYTNIGMLVPVKNAANPAWLRVE